MYNVNDDGTSRLLFSASDITSLAACEWRTVRRIDFLLGLPGSSALPPENDAMLALAGEAGNRFEKRVLSDLRAQYGDEQVVEFPDPGRDADTATFTQLAEQTLDQMRAGIRVIHQATVFNGEMRGHIDFLIRDENSDEITYQVIDTKLARHVKVTALMQLASYFDQLDTAGITPSASVSLWLGDGAKTQHRISEILPTYRRQRQRLRDLVADRRADSIASAWGDSRYDACGRCETCKVEIKSHDDVIQVAGIMRSQRRLLIAAGISRLDELAKLTPEHRVEGIPRETLKKLVTQAKAQVATRQGNTGVPVVAFRNPAFLSRIPKPSAGDIFFDFEGNPLDDESPDAIAEENKWGIDYLFGFQSATFIPDTERTDALNDPQFSYYWADDKAQERKAFDDFMTWLASHRATHPDMHIYHYAAYEKTHLLSLAQRHDIHIEAVDDLIRQGVLVDLYPITKAALVIGSHSYSIKKLEPLYMGAEVRSGLDNAADSVKDYAEYRIKLDELAFETDPVQRDEISLRLTELKRSIIDYNRYDCRSTLKLRDWLIERAAEAGVAIGVRPIIDERPPPPVPPSYLALRSLVDDVDPAERSPLHEAIAIAASAVVYHRNEDKKWWREHFDRTSQEDVDDWVDVRDSVIFDPDDVTVLMRGLGEDANGWYVPAGKRTPRRRIRAKMAKIVPGTKLDKLSELFVAYPSFAIDEEINGADPLPHAPAPEMHTFYLMCKLESADVQGDYVEFDETLKAQQPRFSAPPVALVPGKPIPQDSVKKAIDSWARDLYSRLVEDEIFIPAAGSEEANLFEVPSRWPSFGRDAQAMLAGQSLELWGDPMFDILLRRAPRTADFASQSEDTIPAIVDALKSMDDSFIAVQGPPGTGKTFTGGRVIAQLLSEGWKIGVVSQAHLTVENMLESVIDAGADPELVGKRPKKDDAGTLQQWEVIEDSAPAVVAWQAGKDKFVLGGTKWTFTNDVAYKNLDLLVVDEAGQYSLADTMACSVATKRLLLLGDPQQLAQVTQGVHLEKVDESGLGWIVGEADVISPDLGFLMRQTYRMNDGVREVVSNLSYAGQLTSDESANRRLLDDVAPGLALSRVNHQGNSVQSVEEAERIVAIVGNLIGNAWSGPKTHGGDAGAPLREEDIIVVSPYNAQVDLVSSLLAVVGYPDVRVGTVDRFQGREAAVSIVSLAASSQRDVPRGIEFLLEPNRLNVAISRAQFASILVYSPAIETFVPTNEASLKLLSDFLNVIDQGHEYELPTR